MPAPSAFDNTIWKVSPRRHGHRLDPDGYTPFRLPRLEDQQAGVMGEVRTSGRYRPALPGSVGHRHRLLHGSTEADGEAQLSLLPSLMVASSTRRAATPLSIMLTCNVPHRLAAPSTFPARRPCFPRHKAMPTL